MTLIDIGLENGSFDWDAIDARFDWVRALRGCRQNPVYHAEGDVWIHTKMVLTELTQLAEFQALDEEAQWITFAAALLHDVGKPETTREQDGRIRSPGHSSKGAIRARRILWELGVEPRLREEVCRIIAVHQIPFFLPLDDAPERTVHRTSWNMRCDRLSLVAEADARGRLCEDQVDLVTRVELFRELCQRESCLRDRFAFGSDHSAFLYFRTKDRDPRYVAHDDTRGEVVILCGLPASGKDHWARAHRPSLPVVSLDAIRAELGVDPAAKQGAVVRAAFERAKGHLRQCASFVWNATNLTRETRERIVTLATRYHMRIRIVHVETTPAELRRRNAARRQRVPQRIIDKMLSRWEAPSPDEAQIVEYHVT